MALTLITQPTEQFLSAMNKIEYVFKREDQIIIDTESGVNNKLEINLAVDLTSLLIAGDYIYINSEIYDGSYIINAITVNSITIDTEFIGVSTGGYINYLLNYYVEMQCVSDTNDLINLLPFNIKADGDNAGNIKIDVSVLGDLLRQTKILSESFLSDESLNFKVQYRAVYSGSSNPFILINTTKTIIYSIETPNTIEVLNLFNEPKIYLGYKQHIKTLLNFVATEIYTLKYRELNNNKVIITSDNSLNAITTTFNGYYCFDIPANLTLNSKTKYLFFSLSSNLLVDFKAIDFETPDFKTT